MGVMIAVPIGFPAVVQADNVISNQGDNKPAQSLLATDDKRQLLALSPQEKAWLLAHPIIRVGITRDFPPYEWIDEKGQYVGPVAEYMAILEEKLGVKFDIVHDRPWADILEMAKHGELELLSCVNKTPDRSQFLTFTEPYKTTHIVIIDNGQQGFIGSLDQLNGKRVSIEKGYFMQELMRRNHPNILVIPAESTEKALDLVVSGRADAYIGDAGTANYFIRKGALFSLRFSGQTEYNSQYRIAANKAFPELTSILNKAIATIPKQESETIFNHWLGLKIEQGIRLETVIKYSSAILTLFMFFAFWTIRLRQEVNLRKRAEIKLQKIIESSPIPLSLANEQGKILYLNSTFITNIGYTVSDIPYLTDWFFQAYPDEQYRQLVSEEWLKGLDAAKTNKSAFIPMEVNIRCKNGATKTFIVGASTIEEDISSVHLTSFVDISERKSAEDALNLQKDYLKAIFDTEPECVKIVSPECALIDMNPAGLRMLEVDTLEEAKQKGLLSFVERSHVSAFIDLHKNVMKGNSGVLEFPIKGIKGGRRWLETHATPLRNKEGQVINLLGLTRDITERKQAEEELKKAKEAATQSAFLGDQALELAQAGPWNIDFSEGGEYYISSPRLVEIFGDPPREGLRYHIMNDWYVNLEAADKILAQATLNNYQDALAGRASKYDMIHPYRRPIDGRIVWVHVLGHVVRDQQQGNPAHMYGVIMDITQQKLFEQELERRAHTDYLTGVSNRGHFKEKAELELTRAIRYQNDLSIFMMDIDHFKLINDNHGHKAGDLVLKKLAEICRQTLREIDVIGRIGGEEFAILLPETNIEEATEVAERLRSELAGTKVPIDDGLPLHFTVSIGVSTLISPNDKIDVLLHMADKALYEAKHQGRNKVSVSAGDETRK